MPGAGPRLDTRAWAIRISRALINLGSFGPLGFLLEIAIWIGPKTAQEKSGEQKTNLKIKSQTKAQGAAAGREEEKNGKRQSSKRKGEGRKKESEITRKQKKKTKREKGSYGDQNGDLQESQEQR